MDSFLGVLSFQVHKWKQLIEVSIYYDFPSTYFTMVADSGSIDVSVLSAEELLHSGS